MRILNGWDGIDPRMLIKHLVSRRREAGQLAHNRRATSGRTIARLSFLPWIVALSACTTPQTVPVQVPFPVPGPSRYKPIPAELLTCDELAALGAPPEKGRPVGNLFAWARSADTAVGICLGKLEQARAIAVPDSVRR